MLSKIKSCTICLFILSITFSYSQTDTEFWFVAPDVTSSHGNKPILFRISSYSEAADIIIEQPANPNFLKIELSLPANSSQSIDVTNQINNIQNQPTSTVLPYGFRIRSTSLISVYYEVNMPFNTDIFSLKGRNALGTNFFIPIQNKFPNASYSYPARSGFDIVATQENTIVTITPKVNTTTNQAGIPFQITLNTGETYSVMALNSTSNEKLTGSQVTSTKPIAVTMKDDSSYGPTGCQDLNGDQIVPTSILGLEHIIVKGFLNNGDYAFVVASEDNTQISVNGNPLTTINTGDSYTIPVTQDAIYLTTDKPSYVLHLSGYGCELGAALLPQINCTGSRKVNFVRSTNDPLFLILFTESGNEGNFLLDGNPNIVSQNQFLDVPGTAGAYKYARIAINSNLVPVESFSTLENNSGAFHLGIINGSPGGGTRYGYFSDFRNFSFELTSNGTIFCEGDNLIIEGRNIDEATYEWSGPGNFELNNNILTINNLTEKDSGEYCLKGIINGCTIEEECVSITVFPIDVEPTFDEISPICYGDMSYKLPTISNNGIQGSWSPTLNNSTTTTYTFTPDPGQCATTQSLEIIVLTPPPPPVGDEIQILCASENPTLLDLNLNTPFISWFSTESGGNALDPSTPLTEDTLLYASSYDITSGCESITRTEVMVLIINPENPNLNPIICLEDNQTIADIPTDGFNMKWYDSPNYGNLLPADYNPSNFETIYGNAYDEAVGCESLNRIAIKINRFKTKMNYNNLITVDGNNYNNALKFEGIEEFPINRMEIFNRYGNLVWELEGYDNINKVFDGSANVQGVISKGSYLPSGTYFFILRFSGECSESELRGFFHLDNSF